jgi:hypothetical protein
MRRSIRYAAPFTVAIASLFLSASANAAQPVEQFHDRFTDTFRINDLCGFTVRDTVTVTDNFFAYADGSFTDTGSVRQKLTNVRNGRSVIVAAAGRSTGTAIVDEDAGTITFISTQFGLQERIQTPDGPVLLRDAGIITFTDTFDLATDALISSEIAFTGPHPEAESDFEAFCEIVTPLLS